MKGCGVELRVSDWQMNAWTWRVYDTVKARRGMADDRYKLKRQVWTWLNCLGTYTTTWNRLYILQVSYQTLVVYNRLCWSGRWHARSHVAIYISSRTQDVTGTKTS